MPAAADRAGEADAGAHCPRPHAGDAAGRGAAREDAVRWRRRADPRICAVEPGGRGADVPRRGAAAHSRRRHARRPDPRQDRRRRLARPSRPEPVAVRECRDLGTAADRATDRDQQRAGPVGGAGPPDRARRRAVDPHRRQHRHAPDGRAVRRRPDDRRGARQRPRPRGAEGFRHSYDMLGEAAVTAEQAYQLHAGLRGGHPRHRRAPRAAPRHLRRAGHLDQAVGAASALQPRADRARAGRALSAAQGRWPCWRATTTSGSTSMPRRPIGWRSRSISWSGSASSPSSKAGTASASSCRPTRSARSSRSTG